MDLKKSILARHLRPKAANAADAPPAASVDFDPTDTSAKVLDPALVADWRASSWDLLNGVDIRDHSDSIPGELFEKLFKR